MVRQSVTTDNGSGITNDANLWATETMGDLKYPLELFLRVVTVGLETMKAVNLPRLQEGGSKRHEPHPSPHLGHHKRITLRESRTSGD